MRKTFTQPLKLSCAELAEAIREAKSSLKRYSDISHCSTQVLKASEEHLIFLLKAQQERAK